MMSLTRHWVLVGTLFRVDSIHHVLTGATNRCPGSGSYCIFLMHGLDSLLENIHLQRQLELPQVWKKKNPKRICTCCLKKPSFSWFCISCPTVIIIFHCASVITWAPSAAETGLGFTGSSQVWSCAPGTVSLFYVLEQRGAFWGHLVGAEVDSEQSGEETGGLWGIRNTLSALTAHNTHTTHTQHNRLEPGVTLVLAETVEIRLSVFSTWDSPWTNYILSSGGNANQNFTHTPEIGEPI